MSLLLIGEVNEEMVKQVADYLINSEGIVEVVLCSGGGMALDGLAIAGLFHNHPKPVHVRAYGKVMSAATLILASADKRAAASTTWFMVHEDTVEVEGSTAEVKATAKQQDAEEAHWNSFMQKFTGTAAATWDKLSTATTYFTATKALELGLIDEILDGIKEN